MSSRDDRHDHEPGRSRRALRAVRSRMQPGSFPLLLSATVLLYVLNGLAVGSRWGTILVQVARIGVLCAGVYVLSAYRLMLWLGTIVAVAVFTLEAGLRGLDPQVSRLLQDALTTGLLLWVLGAVLREVFRASTTERDAVTGALCGFLLILMAFLRLHGLLQALDPDAYQAGGAALSGHSEAMLVATFQYFSTVTLTTVGFGDIVPVTPLARVATGVEAIVGQLYLAVVIATLVGRVVARRD